MRLWESVGVSGSQWESVGVRVCLCASVGVCVCQWESVGVSGRLCVGGASEKCRPLSALLIRFLILPSSIQYLSSSSCCNPNTIPHIPTNCSSLPSPFRPHFVPFSVLGVKQLVLVGDHCQLGPVVMCKKVSEQHSTVAENARADGGKMILILSR